jgi:predicted outer membrane repeat protein
MRQFLFTLWVAFLFALALPTLAEAQIYVDQDATGAGDGTSWADAYPDLQTAIDNATGESEIWIAEGIYTPDSEGDSFTITGAKDGIELYGGFDGTETARDQRDPAQHRTILSGDLKGDDTDPDGDGIIEDAVDGMDGDGSDLQGTNATHVLRLDGTATGITNATEINGVVVTAGMGDGDPPNNRGGGLYCRAGGGTCSPTLQNIGFVGNTAGFGAGIYNEAVEGGTASPVIKKAVFRGNAAAYFGKFTGASGGAIHNTATGFDGTVGRASPTIEHTVFTGNAAYDRGGAMYSDAFGDGGIASLRIVNSVFEGNVAPNGGALYTGASLFLSRAHVQITGTVFVNNAAAEETTANGGAILNRTSVGTAILSITNTTFTGNTAVNNGGAIYNSGEARVTNAILWDNRVGGNGSGLDNEGTSATLSHTLVEGGAGGVDGSAEFLDESGSSVSFTSSTNLDDNPQLVEPRRPIGPDSVFATADDGVIPIAGSPAVDAGVNDSVDVVNDLTGAPRIRDRDGDGSAVVNLGAYERLGRLWPDVTTEGVKSVTGTSADVTGTVDPNGAATRAEVQIFPAADPSSGRTIPADSLMGAADQSVSVSVEALRPETLYEARIRAINSEGDVRGGFVSFTTEDKGPPVAKTDAPSSVGVTTAELAGTVNPGGADTDVTFRYRTVGASSFTSVTAAESPLTGTSDQSASASVDALQPNTDYEVNVTASNAEGADEGSLKTFTTKNIGVSVTGGGFGGLGRTFRATPGEANQPIGLFRLTPTQGGVDLTEVSVTPDNPGVRGVDRISVWISGDDRFDPSGDTELASLDLDPRADLPSPLTLGGFTETLPAEARTLFVAVTLTGEAAGEVTGYLADQTALALEGGAITEVNGNEQTSFSNLPLSEEDSALPVELAAFEGTRVDGGVRLSWTTTSETNNAGFQVQRRTEGSSRSDGSWSDVRFVEGAGKTSNPQTYRFTDRNVPYSADSLSYRLEQVDADGTVSQTEPVTVIRRGPSGVELLGTTPNPARQHATVRYAIPESVARNGGGVTLQVYDVMGRQVRSIRIDGTAGRHTQRVDVADLASGVYFLRLRSPGRMHVQKMTVLN